MTIENLKAGLEILIAEGCTGYCVSAEHDIFYAGHEDGAAKVSDDGKAKLASLGWHIDSASGSWAAFT